MSKTSVKLGSGVHGIIKLEMMSQDGKVVGIIDGIKKLVLVSLIVDMLGNI